MKWTAEQHKAIYDTGGTLLVSAAAGSGKTAVLVERAVQMITRAENPIPADRLLIVTFTNAAAEELRARIARRVEQEALARPGDTALRRQRLLLRRAVIGTMDAYCQQLVKENFARLDLPPDVAVGDEALLAQLSAEALADTMEEMYADADFAAFASLYDRARSDRAAESAVLNLYDFTRTLPQPGRQLARFAAMYQEESPVAQTLWGKELLAYGQQAVAAAGRLLEQAIDIVQQDEALLPYLPALAADLTGAQRLELAVLAQDWDGSVQALQAWVFGPIGLVRGYEGGNKDRVKRLRDEVKDIAEKLGKYCFACTEAQFAADRAEAGPMVAALTRATALYEQKYYERKLAERVLEFADFEHLALALLLDGEGNRTEMARQVSRRYDTVMVDEYQDTNELQSTLYECLGNEDGSNLFYVGDVKQSIYRFRKANPGIFLDKKERWAAFDTGVRPGVLSLGHNFRSGSGVIGGVNHVFGVLMSPALGEVDYGGSERLIQGSEGGDEAGFELCILQSDGRAGDAEYVAGRIAQMLQEGYVVRGREGERRCEYGDFCILLRAAARMPEYVAALEARGIPVTTVGREELLQTPEVLPVTAALAAIDNPGDDVSVAAALLGPLFRFTPDEVTRLRAAAPRGSLWGALTASEDEKAAAFVRDIGLYRALAGEMSAGRLCEELVSRTGYLSAVAAMRGGDARRENLLRFIGWAAEVSAAGRGGLSGFVRLLQSGNGPAPPAAGAVAGKVNIMTIHKSKGLEFPVCFLADAARMFNTMDLAGRVQMHAELGVGIKLRAGESIFATLPALAIRRRAEREAMSEEMRVLYVALTRAKDKMIVTFAHKDPPALLSAQAALVMGQEADAFLLSNNRSFAQWTVAAALCHPDAQPFLEHTGGAIPPVRAAAGRFVMRIDEATAQDEAEEEKFVLTAAPDSEAVRQLLESFAAALPYEPLRQVPVKLSVSRLAKQEGEALRRRPSFMYSSGLTAAEKGTAQHSFMQFADYGSARQDIEGEILRLVQQGYMEAALAEKLDRAAIGAFLASPVARRMAEADEVLREYAFITAIPAGDIEPGLAGELATRPVMLQGIADAVLLKDGAAEIVDYKTDRGKTAQQLASTYRQQLMLYKAAVEKRLGVPVNKLTIWSFALESEIEVK